MRTRTKIGAGAAGVLLSLGLATSASAHKAVVTCARPGVLAVSNDFSTTMHLEWWNGLPSPIATLDVPAAASSTSPVVVEVPYPNPPGKGYALGFVAFWGDGVTQPPSVPVAGGGTAHGVQGISDAVWLCRPGAPVAGTSTTVAVTVKGTVQPSTTAAPTTSTTVDPTTVPASTSTSAVPAVVSVGGPTTTGAPAIVEGGAISIVNEPVTALPRTGAAEAAGTALYGAGFLMLGLVLVAAGRRRKAALA